MTVFALDTTGSATTNKVNGELIYLDQTKLRERGFLGLSHGPFYEDGLIVTYAKPGANPVVLERDVHYSLVFHFTGLTGNGANRVFGSINIFASDSSGLLSVDYQALGGDWVIDGLMISQFLSDNYYNRNVATLELVPASPVVLPGQNTPIELDSFEKVQAALDADAPIRLTIEIRPIATEEVPVEPVGNTPTGQAQDIAGKDAIDGYVGLTGRKINFRNTANTATSYLQNNNTAPRTYLFPDRSGTLLDQSDIAGLVPAQDAILLGSPTAPTALPGADGTQIANTAFVQAAVAQVEGSTTTALGNRLRVDVSTQGLSATQKTNALTNLGIDQIDNTSDANKPVSVAQAAADEAILSAAQNSLGGYPLEVQGLTVDDLLLFNGTAWVNVNKSIISNGGSF